LKHCPRCARVLEARIVDGVERRACAATCGFVHWDNPIPVAAGLVECDGRFILARNAAWPAGLFSMITGFVERGETPEMTLVRETKEELNLEAERLAFIGHYLLPAQNQLLVAFHVRARGELQPSRELAETRVLDRGELGAYDFGPLTLTQQMVRDWLSRAA
jgi:NAD+ diphosphatase